MWKSYEIQMSVSINKDLLDHSHAHLFMYCLWLHSHHAGRAKQLQQRPYGWQKLKQLLSGPLQEKCANLYTILVNASKLVLLSATNC